MGKHVHTFLFREGKWDAKGDYFNEVGQKIAFVGEANITHTEKCWKNNSFMRLLVGDDVEFNNSYEFEPIREGDDFCRWKSYNPDLGELEGKLVVVGDVLLLSFCCSSGHYEGFEYLQMVSDTHYNNKGVLYMGNVKLSSWSSELKKSK